jgi:hypothetical protein
VSEIIGEAGSRRVSSTRQGVGVAADDHRLDDAAGLDPAPAPTTAPQAARGAHQSIRR